MLIQMKKWFLKIWTSYIIFLLLFSLCQSLGNVTQNAPMLLYSTTTDIRIVNTTRSKTKPMILIKNLTDGAALDYHYAQKRICWTDHGLMSIQCVGFNALATDDKVEVISTEVMSPDGLACDWLTNKLYWTDSETNKIEVASMASPYHRKVLFWTDNDQPRAIALDPLKGLMFWTDWGESPKIEKAGMNGEAREVIVSDNIIWPNGLTIDYENNSIYWIDGKLLFIKKMDYNGNIISEILKTGMEYPFALTQFNTKLYWTDWKRWSIYMYDRNGTNHPKEFLHSDNVPMDIHIWDGKRQPSKSNPCELNNGGCSHLCLLSPKEPYYSCACPRGIKLLDNTTCADGPQEMLLFVRRNEMCIVYLDSPDYTHRGLNFTNMKYSVAVDYDPIEGFVYWTDSSIKKIQKAKLDASEQSDVLSYEIDSSDGIAIDWVARNIYWTESVLDRIEVATLDGQYRRVLIYNGLLDPRAIAVSPELGWLFWSDWHNKSHKIERANLDGSERVVIISEKLGWANGLALDVESMKIYWCDAKNDVIEFSNMDGSDRRILVNDNIPHPFGFTIMGNYLYWTDWQSRQISRVNKETGRSRETIVDQIASMMGLKAIKGTPLPSNYTSINPCGMNNGGCAQICLYLHNKSYVCVCQVGYELLKDGKTCVTPDAFLLTTKKDNLTRVSIENPNNELQLPINNIKYASSIDFDPNNNRIYWSDIKQHAILRAYVNGSDPHKVVELGLASPEGLAVDWVALNIYWSDPAAHRIEIARLDGTSRRVLLWGDESVEPHSIVLDPQEGYMYWSEWDNTNNNNINPTSLNSIKRAAMDGSMVKKLILNAVHAMALTLDYEKRKLYWVEVDTPAIMMSDLNGINRKIIDKEGLIRPTGLILYKDYLYYSDENAERQGEIVRVDTKNVEEKKVIHTFNEPVTDLLIVPGLKQRKIFNECAVNNGGCSHLCLALPAPDPSKSTNYTCACPTHYSLQNKTCSPPKKFMIYSHKNLFVRLLPDTSECPQAVFPIQGLKGVKAIDFDPVLQFLYWIEGKNRSIKKGKVIGTSISIVVPGHQSVSPVDIAVDALGRLLFWSCSVENVINVTRLDNNSIVGVVVQGKEPRLIALHPTKRLLIYTDTGSSNTQIIRKRMDGSQQIVLVPTTATVNAIAVDAEMDLVVWSSDNKVRTCNIDGENCHDLLKDFTTLKTTPLAIHAGWLYWLDQDNLQRFDLRNGGSTSTIVEHDPDITDLVSVTQPDKNHACSQIYTPKCSHLCIFNGSNAVCACPHGLELQDDKKTCAANHDCGSEFFTCGISANGARDCIPHSWKCDGQVDCQDRSDEAGCPACNADHFRCDNGDCILAEYVCDTIPQCKDKSDEVQCCKHSHEFQCPGTNVCLSKTWLCDGTEHCADGADEKESVCLKQSYIFGHSDIFWIFMSILSIVIVTTAYCYIRKLYAKNVGTADQSEDPLNPIQNRAQIENQKRNKAMPDVIHMSMLNGSQISYDRDHITGASNSTNESSIACYPRETLNPPPSPATTAASTRTSPLGTRYRPYKHYRSINQPPPPTPCSTDVCDESDYNYTTNSNRSRYEDRNRYDMGPCPPPPTPRSHCNSESCPPSPESRSSTYYSQLPLPPPPSPIASPPRSYDS